MYFCRTLFDIKYTKTCMIETFINFPPEIQTHSDMFVDFI